MQDIVFPPDEFAGTEFEFAFQLHAITCLKDFGFEDRGLGISVETTMKFLRERMRHFDLDILHAPMFGRPPNDWPKIE
jgi:hypothetical protein